MLHATSPIRFASLALAVLSAFGGHPSTAQSVESFYRGKTLSLIVFTSSGGTSDAVARLLADAMPKHIPGNPVIVVKNMVGGGGMVAANHLYNVAPRDGTVFGTLNRPTPFAPLLDMPNVKFDARKFNWLGSEFN
jgi:tripartite-type tricarboxylate transporter receptor subunit TctC